MECTQCRNRNYRTEKNPRNDPDRIEMKKYCKVCRTHTVHRQTR